MREGQSRERERGERERERVSDGQKDESLSQMAGNSSAENSAPDARNIF